MRTLVAEQVTDQLVLKRAADLTAGRPLIQSLVSSVVGGRAFSGAFRSGVRDVHRALFDGDQHTVTLALSDVGTMVAAGLEAVQPSLARRIDTTRRVEVVRRDIGSVTATAARAAEGIKVLALLLLLLAVGCAAGAIWLSADRRRTVVQLGVGAAIGEPTRPALRVLRGVDLIVVGLLFLLARDAVLHLAFALAGLYLIFAGVGAILRLVYQPRPQQAGRPDKRADTGPRSRRRRLVAPVLAALLIAGVIVAFIGSGGRRPLPPPRAVQRPHPAVQALPARGDAGSDAQLDVGAAARVVLL